MLEILREINTHLVNQLIKEQIKSEEGDDKLQAFQHGLAALELHHSVRSQFEQVAEARPSFDDLKEVTSEIFLNSNHK